MAGIIRAGNVTLADISVCYALWHARLPGLDKFFAPNVAYYIERQMDWPAFRSALETERCAAKVVSPSVSDAIGSLAPASKPKIAEG